jgi:hypothetical protein
VTRQYAQYFASGKTRRSPDRNGNFARHRFLSLPKNQPSVFGTGFAQKNNPLRRSGPQVLCRNHDELSSSLSRPQATTQYANPLYSGFAFRAFNHAEFGR